MPDWRRRALFGLGLGFLVYLLGEDLRLVLPWSGRPVTMTLYMLIGAAVALGPRRLQRLYAAGVVLMMVLYALVGTTWLPWWVARPLMVHDPLRPADVIVVLSGATMGAGWPKASTMDRMVQGWTLLEAGYAPHIVFTGSSPNPANTFDRLAPTLMEQVGLDASPVVPFVPITRQGLNTREEALSIAEMAVQHHWREVLLVTSPTHTRRAKGAFVRVLEPLGVTVRVTSGLSSSYDATGRQRIGEFDLWRFIVYEYMGLLVYQLRGWR